jgi:hypothetical protein
MKIRYFFERLSREQKAALEAVLLEEMDIQGWYAVSVSSLMGGEIVIPVQ